MDNVCDRNAKELSAVLDTFIVPLKVYSLVMLKGDSFTLWPSLILNENALG